MGIPMEIIDLTLSDDEEEVVNTAAKKARLENGAEHRRDNPPQPPQPLMIPKMEKDAASGTEPQPKQAARPRCSTSTSPAAPVSGSSKSQGGPSVIRYSNPNGVTSTPGPAPVAVTVSHSHNQGERRHKKPEPVAASASTSRTPNPVAPPTVDKIVSKPGPSDPVAKTPVNVAPPSKVITATATATRAPVRRPSDVELGPKKGYLLKNSNGPGPNTSTSYVAVAAASPNPTSTVITPAAKINGTAGPGKVAVSSKNASGEAIQRPGQPGPLSTPSKSVPQIVPARTPTPTPSQIAPVRTPTPPKSIPQIAPVRTPILTPSPSVPKMTPVRTPSPSAATNNAAESEIKTSPNKSEDEAMKSPTSPDPDRCKAPVLELQTEQPSSASLDLELSGGPPLLTPEVVLPTKTTNSPPNGRMDEGPTLQQREALQKFKIPKKATSENCGASSSATNGSSNRPSLQLFQSAAFSKLDTKLFGKQMERVAHPRPKADVKTTLEMSQSLIRTVQRLKERIPLESKVKLPIAPMAIPSTSSQSVRRVPNLPSTSTSFQKLLPPRKVGKSNSMKITNKTPRQLALLEEKYKETTDPLPTDILELVGSTGLSKPQIQQWFNQKRKRGTDELENTSPSPHSDFTGSETFESTTTARIEDEYEYDDADDVAADNPPTTPVLQSHVNAPHRRIRYLNDLGARTTDLDTLRADLDKVEHCPLVEFKLIMDSMWERKARSIFILVTGTKDNKALLLKEARRIKDKFRADPFSDEQKEELARWKQEFLEKISEDDEKRAQYLHIYDEYVSPWIAPFVYSRVARQDDLPLSLEVAIHDFTRIFSGGSTFDWVTPAMISYLKM